MQKARYEYVKGLIVALAREMEAGLDQAEWGGGGLHRLTVVRLVRLAQSAKPTPSTFEVYIDIAIYVRERLTELGRHQESAALGKVLDEALLFAQQDREFRVEDDIRSCDPFEIMLHKFEKAKKFIASQQAELEM